MQGLTLTRETSELATADRAPSDGARTAILILVGLACAVVYFLAYPRALSGPQTMDAPRDNVGFMFAERLSNGQSMRLPLRHHDALPADIAPALTPRDSASREGQAMPQDFAGTLLLYGLLLAIWKPLTLALSPILTVLSGFVLLQIWAELCSYPRGDASWRRPRTGAEGFLGLVLLAVWLVHPGVVVNGSRIFSSEIPCLFFLLLAFLYLVRFWREGRQGHLVLLAMSVGAAVILRYPSIIVGGVLFIALLVTRRIDRSQVGLIAAVFAPFIGFILVFNYWQYGSVTTTGYGFSSNLIAQSAGTNSNPFLNVQPSVALDHLRFYALNLPMMLAPQLVGALLAIRIWRRSSVPRQLIVALLTATGVYVVYHAGMNTWGSNRPAVNASFIRYTLPAVGLWTLFLAYSAVRMMGRRRLVILGLCVGMIGASSFTAVNSFAGVRYRRQAADEALLISKSVAKITERDALIASRVSDRFIFPIRQTLTMTYLIDGTGPIEASDSGIAWDLLPSVGRFVGVAQHIHAQGIPLYVVGDFNEAILALYHRGLQEKGLGLQLRVGFSGQMPALYQLTSSASASITSVSSG